MHRSPQTGRRSATMVAVMTKERLAWALSAFYFLTFGGFVAFSIYLPTLLRDQFGLSITDAGFRTAGFVVLATLLRPVGGVLSDHIGGARVLSGVFAGVIPFALLLMWPSMVPFTVGALGCAALLGLGQRRRVQTRAAVFPGQHRDRHRTGRRDGRAWRLLPAACCSDSSAIALASSGPGLHCSRFTSLCLWIVNQRVFLPRQKAAERAGRTRLLS